MRWLDALGSLGLGSLAVGATACEGAFSSSTSSATDGGSVADGSGLGDSGGVTDASLDTGVAPGDSGGGDGSAGCSPLASNAPDIYVDETYTGSKQTGVQACPFTTILQGLTAAQGSMAEVRNVHVAGGSPAYVYKEASPPVVGTGIVLLGAGASSVTIAGSGKCGSGSCAVSLDPGAVIDGFTVACTVGATADGIVMGAGALAAAARNVIVSGCGGAGIRALGSADVGPNAESNSNVTGIESPASVTSGTLRILAGTAGPNMFNGNSGNGIDVSGGALLNFEEGSVSKNAQGIRLSGTGSTAASPHLITALTAEGNSGSGVVSYLGQSIKMRSSTLVSNGVAGLHFEYSSTGGGTLDIGTAASLGDNVFGGVTQKNTVAGVQLCGASAVNAALVADGDSWASCPPSQQAVMCGVVTSPAPPYVDIDYSTVPAVASPCTPGM